MMYNQIAKQAGFYSKVLGFSFLLAENSGVLMASLIEILLSLSCRFCRYDNLKLLIKGTDFKWKFTILAFTVFGDILIF